MAKLHVVDVGRGSEVLYRDQLPCLLHTLANRAYFGEVLAEAYRLFGRRAASEPSSDAKQDRVRHYILRQAPPVYRVADVRAALPGVSDPTIRLVCRGSVSWAR